MKYLLYYLIPKKISYKMLYEIMSATYGNFYFNERCESYLKTIYIEYDEYKKMDKDNKLYYFDLYVKNNKILSYIDKNKMNIISIIGIIATFVFGFISIK